MGKDGSDVGVDGVVGARLRRGGGVGGLQESGKGAGIGAAYALRSDNWPESVLSGIAPGALCILQVGRPKCANASNGDIERGLVHWRSARGHEHTAKIFAGGCRVAGISTAKVSLLAKQPRSLGKS